MPAKSNIALKSNIYPCQTERPFYDPDFLAVIESPSALALFKKWKLPMSQAQAKINPRNLACAYHPERGAAIRGLVVKDGRKWLVNRCGLVASCKYAARFNCDLEILID